MGGNRLWQSSSPMPSHTDNSESGPPPVSTQKTPTQSLSEWTMVEILVGAAGEDSREPSAAQLPTESDSISPRALYN